MRSWIKGLVRGEACHKELLLRHIRRDPYSCQLNSKSWKVSVTSVFFPLQLTRIHPGPTEGLCVFLCLLAMGTPQNGQDKTKQNSTCGDVYCSGHIIIHYPSQRATYP